MTVTATPSTALYTARKAARPFSSEDLWTIPKVGPPNLSPDGAAFVVNVTTYDLEKNEGRGRLWLVPASGGGARALTSPEFSSGEPAFAPDGKRLAFTRKNEKGKAQLHVMPLDGGEPRRLTDFPLGVFDPKWLPDGSGIVFAAALIKGHLTPEATATEIARREKDPVKAHVTEDRFYRYWDAWLTTGEVPHLFVYDLATDSIRDLTPESTVWFDWMEMAGNYDIAPDGKEIAYAGLYWSTERVRQAIFVVPTAGGPVQCLTPDHPAEDRKPRYSRDGRHIVYGMTHDSFFYADRARIMAYDRQTKTHAPWIEDWDRSPSNWTFGRDGTLYLEAEHAARLCLFAWRGSGEPRMVARGGCVAGTTTSPDGRLYFTLQNLSQPTEVHTCAADGAGLKRLTTFTDETTSRFGLGEVREMQFEGAYGETIQMFLVMPPGHEAGQPIPLVQVIHGGPHGISPDSFHSRWNAHLFAAPGYMVAMVNFQGSTSWGQDFAKRIQGGWGDRPFKDVMLATDALVSTGMVDENRMAATGGSYGGYMASWIEGHTDRFRCIINHAGVYDTLAQYASDWTMGRAQAFGGEPWDGLEAIDRYNPARFAKGFNTPMLVLHGERDYRVPVAQGLECYDVLKAKGVPARLVYFPDENHWILKPKNSILWYREVHAWLERFLKG